MSQYRKSSVEFPIDLTTSDDDDFDDDDDDDDDDEAQKQFNCDEYISPDDLLLVFFFFVDCISICLQLCSCLSSNFVCITLSI